MQQKRAHTVTRTLHTATATMECRVADTVEAGTRTHTADTAITDTHMQQGERRQEDTDTLMAEYHATVTETE